MKTYVAGKEAAKRRYVCMALNKVYNSNEIYEERKMAVWKIFYYETWKACLSSMYVNVALCILELRNVKSSCLYLSSNNSVKIANYI
jgi:hypothetical protein